MLLRRVLASWCGLSGEDIYVVSLHEGMCELSCRRRTRPRKQKYKYTCTRAARWKMDKPLAEDFNSDQLSREVESARMSVLHKLTETFSSSCERRAIVREQSNAVQLAA